MLKQRFEKALTFPEYLETVDKNRELWHAMAQRVRIAPEVARRAERVGGQWHLLALSEDWCGDAVNTLPVVAALADAAANLELRVLGRDDNPDLMDAHLTGTSRSIPVVMLLDAGYEERGWWGSRPAELQRWVMEEGMELHPEDRYREVRRWYARDRGATTLREILELLEEAASTASR